jgi:hypothetical protein
MRLAVRKLEVGDVAELVKLIVDNIESLERGLSVIDTRILLGHATIDVVAVDPNGTLVFVALGRTADERMLLNVVDAYSWCLEYPEAMQRLYPNLRISADRPPRVLFVVERMPDSFQRKMRQLNFGDAGCIEFRHVEVNGVSGVLFDRVAQAERPAAPASASPVVAVEAPARHGHPAPSPNGHGGPLTMAPPSVASPVTETAAAPAAKMPATGPDALPEAIARARMEAVGAVNVPALELESKPSEIVPTPPALENIDLALTLIQDEPAVDTSAPVTPAPTPVPSVALRGLLEEVAKQQATSPAADARPAAETRDAADTVEPAGKNGPKMPSWAKSPAPTKRPEPPSAEPAKAPEAGAAPATSGPVDGDLPAELDNLKFPKDGVLTRQWMDFLNQMAGSK